MSTISGGPDIISTSSISFPPSVSVSPPAQDGLKFTRFRGRPSICVQGVDMMAPRDALENQALHRRLRKCRAHPDRRRADHFPGRAYGPGGPKNGAPSPRVRPARSHKPHAQKTYRSAARTTAADRPESKSVEARVMLLVNRTAVGLTRQSIPLHESMFLMDARVKAVHDEPSG